MIHSAVTSEDRENSTPPTQAHVCIRHSTECHSGTSISLLQITCLPSCLASCNALYRVAFCSSTSARHIVIAAAIFTSTLLLFKYNDIIIQYIKYTFIYIVVNSAADKMGSELRQELAAAAQRLGSAANYRSAGTVEFLVDDDTAKFYFLEVNTRLQVRYALLPCATS